MKTLKQYSILAFLSLCVCTSCTKETGMEGSLSQGKGYLEVFGSIGEGYALQTRADDPSTESTGRAPVDEFYSFKSTSKGGGFKNGCMIGLYSQNSTAGNFDENRLVNTPLTYKKEGEKGGSFTNEGIDIPSMSNLGRTFVYYPYSVNNETENEGTGNTLKYPINLEYSSDDDPNKLEEKDNNRVIDLLTAKSSGINGNGQIYYSFSHACSMLMIYRGEGFVLADRETETNDVVEVKLKIGRKAFVRSTDISKNDFSLDTEDDKTQVDLIYRTNVTIENEGDSEKAQSINTVILPPGAEIEYIMMTDTFGTKQYIYPEQPLKLTGGKKQPVTVSLKGLDPTIFPHEITDWDNVEVTIETKNKGIYDLYEFNAWINAYSTNDETTLKNYGTKVGDKWTFHIYSDIDFENKTTVQSFIPEFRDNLEGHGHTLKNISLQQQTNSTDTNCGFVGNLNGGSINNLKIDRISVTSSADTEYHVGTIAGTITNGSITNCKITGINIECEKGFAGALAGSISAGTIETCLLEGNLKLGKDAKNVAGDNSYKLFGKVETGVTVKPENINTVKVNVFQAGK